MKYLEMWVFDYATDFDWHGVFGTKGQVIPPHLAAWYPEKDHWTVQIHVEYCPWTAPPNTKAIMLQTKKVSSWFFASHFSGHSSGTNKTTLVHWCLLSKLNLLDSKPWPGVHSLLLIEDGLILSILSSCTDDFDVWKPPSNVGCTQSQVA